MGEIIFFLFVKKDELLLLLLLMRCSIELFVFLIMLNNMVVHMTIKPFVPILLANILS